MSKKIGAVWECECGAIAHGKYPPEDCSKCLETNSFVELSDDELEAREDEHIIGQIRANGQSEVDEWD